MPGQSTSEVSGGVEALQRGISQSLTQRAGKATRQEKKSVGIRANPWHILQMAHVVSAKKGLESIFASYSTAELTDGYCTALSRF